MLLAKQSYSLSCDLLVYVVVLLQQLLDSTAIISVLETYLQDKSSQLRDIIKFYPATKYLNDDGKSTTDIANKYFIMHNAVVPDERERIAEL